MLYERHYSARKNRKSKQIVGPGYSIVLLTHDDKALFVWQKQKYRNDGQHGINCAVFRNEGAGLASALILEAEQIVWQRWPGERLYTYVAPKLIDSINPGCCFKKAGWRVCGESGSGLLILEKLPEA
ncbi:hypothetical protein [Hymenobacter metallilatus]|uniref:Uncharacterized protein n=1 Tax=Hymenobacter metallilatus TaxID=2493666 RepID=A0A3R9M7M0_9BACT|nr:hypothetical protein [Hymenobacter metallilatus]RSK24204.1 hypothetical protein EI290_20710 [Hymenobacter metallilatus]